MKLNKSTIKEILEPKPKFKYRQVEKQATTMSDVSEDSWDSKPKKITPTPAPENQKKKGVHFI